MKNIIVIIMVIFSTILVNSCKKSGNSGTGNTSYDTGKDKVQWTYDGITSSCDSSFALVSLNRIMAYKGSDVNSKTLTLNLRSLAVGSYSLIPTPPNVLTYVVAITLDHTSQSGTVNITANTGAKISGNVNAILENGLPFSGSFSEVPMRK